MLTYLPPGHEPGTLAVDSGDSNGSRLDLKAGMRKPTRSG
jgi:hypothetical protein